MGSLPGNAEQRKQEGQQKPPTVIQLCLPGTVLPQAGLGESSIFPSIVSSVTLCGFPLGPSILLSLFPLTLKGSGALPSSPHALGPKHYTSTYLLLPQFIPNGTLLDISTPQPTWLCPFGLHTLIF